MMYQMESGATTSSLAPETAPAPEIAPLAAPVAALAAAPVQKYQIVMNGYSDQCPVPWNLCPVLEAICLLQEIHEMKSGATTSLAPETAAAPEIAPLAAPVVALAAAPVHAPAKENTQAPHQIQVFETLDTPTDPNETQDTDPVLVLVQIRTF